MSKSNLAVKEELENVAVEDVIIINQNEQENYRPSKDKEIRVNNNLSYNCGCLVYKNMFT